MANIVLPRNKTTDSRHTVPDDVTGVDLEAECAPVGLPGSETSAAPIQVLALDTGGLRGIFTAATLAAWEDDVDTLIADHFDLIVGTSTGGIITFSLGLGVTPAEVLPHYTDHGDRIFPPARQNLLTNTILPSMCEWLLHYEFWLAAGEWHRSGGNPHRSDQQTDHTPKIPFPAHGKSSLQPLSAGENAKH